MARGKKKEELTLEEKLERALVPVEEQPYEVPGNWSFFRFTCLIDIEGGTQPPKRHFIEKQMDGYVRLVQIRDFASDKYVIYVPDTKKLRKFNKNDVMIARYGASVGKICTGLEGAYNVALAKTIFSREILNRDYVYWMLQSENFQNPLTRISRSAQAGFNKEDLSSFVMPLPPLKEQKRIVEKIESLFPKLNEISEKIKSVFEQYKKDRATLIHKAYIGELTKHWRKECGIDKNWEQIKIKELCKSLKYGTSKKSKEKGTMIVVRMGNLQNGEIIWDNLAYTDDYEDIEKYMLEKGDVLFNRTNSSEWVGKTSIYRGEYPAIYAGYLIKLDYYRDKVIGDFLNYMLNSPKAKEYCNLVKTDGVNQSNINAKKIGEFEIPVPSLEEQREIVRILDVMLIKQKRVLELAEAIMEEIEVMKKSILSKAFRGKLSTNNSEEESSIELLKKILVET